MKGCPKCGSNIRTSERNPRDLDWIKTVCQCGHIQLRYRKRSK